MIASLNGRITDIGENSLTLDMGGVGLKVSVPSMFQEQVKIGKMVFLHTYLVVRENELTLYGFPSKEEREIFTLLLGVSGIGPRLALVTVSTLEPNAIQRAVFNGQPEVLASVPGIGKKTAQSMILHLQDKIIPTEGWEPVAEMDEVDSQVLAALTALGYSVVEAQAALQTIPQNAPEDLEERLRLALAYFGG